MLSIWEAKIRAEDYSLKSGGVEDVVNVDCSERGYMYPATDATKHAF